MNSQPQSAATETSSAQRDGVSCALLPIASDLGAITDAVYERLEDGGCPLAHSIRDRIGFETLLADLSAMFVNVHPDQVDEQIIVGLRHIVEFLGIDRSGLAQLVPGGTDIAITHSYQIDGIPPTPKVLLETRFPVYARKIKEGKPFRLPDDVQDIPEADEERKYLSESGLKSQLTIPLKVTGIVVGGIGFASFRAPVEWPAELVQRLRMVGDIFTNALARKQTDQALRVLSSKLLTAQEEERRRLAREMHDDWTQRLAVLGLDVAMLEKSIDNPAVTAPLIRKVQEQLVALSGDVHDLSRQLHPAILDDLGLVEALRSECAAFSRRERIVVDYRADAMPKTISQDVGLCLYRVAQEALRNIGKHAAVAKCWVMLSMRENRLELTVRDEGIGFAQTSVRQAAGIGLASIEERVRLARAQLTVTSAPGQGTTILVRAPLENTDP